MSRSLNTEVMKAESGNPSSIMAGFIVLGDGRAYASANWAYDAVIERIADALPDNDAGRALSGWLLEQRSLIQGPGLGSVDLRELTPSNQHLFEIATRKAFAAAKRLGPEGWSGDPNLYPGWLDRFQDLLRMMESICRGELPSAFNPHMTDVVPPTGERSGPGWDGL